MRAMFSMTRTCLRNSLRMPQTRLLLPQRHAYSTAPPPPIGLDQGERNIYSKLASRFQPSQLQVQDISGGCGSFYAISITSKAFSGLPIVKQHRLVNDALKEEIPGIHGLQLKTIPDSN